MVFVEFYKFWGYSDDCYVCTILNVHQAAYLVGLADPTSEPGFKGIIDQSKISRANQAIQSACETLANPASTQQQVSVPFPGFIAKEPLLWSII